VRPGGLPTNPSCHPLGEDCRRVRQGESVEEGSFGCTFRRTSRSGGCPRVEGRNRRHRQGNTQLPSTINGIWTDSPGSSRTPLLDWIDEDVTLGPLNIVRFQLYRQRTLWLIPTTRPRGEARRLLSRHTGRGQWRKAPYGNTFRRTSRSGGCPRAWKFGKRRRYPTS